MITKAQEEWLATLSDKPVTIIPYDPRSDRIFSEIKEKIISVLGPDVVVEHSGASGLGISGQDEIDVSIPSEAEKFDQYITGLEKALGPMKVRYPERVRFSVKHEGKKIDLQLIDKLDPAYLNSKKFEAYLRGHPSDLERYRIFKENGNGLTVKQYYRNKIEFINEILAR